MGDIMNEMGLLAKYGENFTERTYVTNPAIGRDEEIKQLILILLTPEKSGILVGKPGIGKTAIVEGLGYRIQRGEVPDALKGYTVIKIKTASLLGTMPNGESKVQLMIDELKEREKTILFIDEIHMLIGATDESSVDFANIFKEGLGRGSIKVVGATTTAEYERYILRDKAFVRRFQKVEVPEPTREETIDILVGTLPKIEKTTGVRLKYSKYQQRLIMESLVDITSEYKRVFEANARYPDVSLTLLKSAFSFAVFDNRSEVNIYDFEKAIESTHLVYPDVIKKELPIFKDKFKDIYNEENGIVKEGIVLQKNTYATDAEHNINNKPTPQFDASLLAGIDLSGIGNNQPQQPTQQVAPNPMPIQQPQPVVQSAPVQSAQDSFASPELIEQIYQQQAQMQQQNTVAGPVQQQVYQQPSSVQQPTYVQPQQNVVYVDPSMISDNRRSNINTPRRVDNTAIDGILTSNRQMMNASTNFDLDLENRDDIDNRDDDFYE